MRVSRLAVLLATALTLAACSSKATNSTSSGTDNTGVKTDIGVTATEITLGVMTDLTGPIKTLGLGVTQGNELWVKDFNAAGGVCGRKVVLQKQDHGYKADQAKAQYPQISPKVLGFLQLLGSPMVAALKENLASDGIVTTPVSWSSQLLNSRNLMIVGTTYDLEMIDGLSFMRDKGLIPDGTTVGHIVVKGEYGENGLRGSKFYAGKHNLKIKEVLINSTDTDLNNVVTGLKGDGVSAILLTTTPGQSASVAAANQALRLDVPILANNPGFDPTLLTGPAAGALGKFYVTGSTVPFAAAKDLIGKYKATYKETPNAGVPIGYAFGHIWAAVLKKACTNKDLTRAGIVAALGQTTTADTGDLVAPLDFTHPGAPPTRQAYVAQPDKQTEGGLKVVAPLFEAADAKDYKAPHEN